jgi:hypothetical protein
MLVLDGDRIKSVARFDLHANANASQFSLDRINLVNLVSG